MKIILDAMSGDNAPREILRGAALARKRVSAEIVLVGDPDRLRIVAAENNVDLNAFGLVPAADVLTMEDDALTVVRSKKNSSMAIGLKQLCEDGDAFVSAGNTGALHAGATLIVRPIKGIRRAAIATVLPVTKPVLLIDSGANINVTADNMVQWALMGSIYMSKIFGIASPEIGLLNNGEESHKGTPLAAEAHRLLREEKGLNFIGNIEGNQIMSGPCDVLVTDGFTGNITLKFLEGMGRFFLTTLKSMYTENAATKMSFLVMRPQLQRFKEKFDASEYGGAPLLGISRPVIKAHGSSDAVAICNAIRQAESFVGTGVIAAISERLTSEEGDKEGVTGDEKGGNETSETESRSSSPARGT